MIQKILDEVKNNPDIKTWTVVDAQTFIGETVKEKYEGLYLKIVEMTNLLAEKASRADFPITEFIITASRPIAMIFACSRTYCFSQPSWETEKGKFYLGSFGPSHDWKIWLDDDMPDNRIEIIASRGERAELPNYGKAILFITNGSF